jgi:hypothetical protein
MLEKLIVSELKEVCYGMKPCGSSKNRLFEEHIASIFRVTSLPISLATRLRLTTDGGEKTTSFTVTAAKISQKPIKKFEGV